jgi:hypothetical protein
MWKHNLPLVMIGRLVTQIPSKVLSSKHGSGKRGKFLIFFRSIATYPPVASRNVQRRAIPFEKAGIQYAPVSMLFLVLPIALFTPPRYRDATLSHIIVKSLGSSAQPRLIRANQCHCPRPVRYISLESPLFCHFGVGGTVFLLPMIILKVSYCTDGARHLTNTTDTIE